MEKMDRERVVRVARLYASLSACGHAQAGNQEAGQALGATSRNFSRACRRYGIETPYVRRRRQPQRGRGRSPIR